MATRKQTAEKDINQTTHPTEEGAINCKSRKMNLILQSLTQLGGEVCKIRAEFDELLEQNETLIETLKKLKNVLNEKGYFNTDDFDLACDVLEESEIQGKQLNYRSFYQ